MVTVEELVVKATPEGIGEVESQLEGMANTTEETTGEMEDQAQALNDMTNKFAGAMGAITAGFAIVSGSLLSRVPVLGSAMSGLAAILDAIGLKIDQTLRPALMPLTDLFFRIANAINDTDGALGRLVGIISTVVALGSALGAALAGVVTSFLALGGSMSTVVSVGSTVLGVLGSIAAAIVSLPALLIGAALALVGFGIAYNLNWFGIRDTTNRVINKIIKIVKNGFTNFINAAIKFLTGFVATAKKKFNTLKKNTTEVFDNLISDAIQFGKDLVSNFASGIRDRISEAVAAASELASEVRDRLPSSPAETGPLSDLDQTGPGMVDTFASGINNQTSATKPVSDKTLDQRASRAIGRSNDRTVISIDGREVERATQSYRDNGTDLRGRYG